MWKSTDVEDALPLIVFVVASTCFRSKNADELAATDTEPTRSISSSNSDAVTAEPVGLAITMFVTTAVVEDGTV